LRWLYCTLQAAENQEEIRTAAPEIRTPENPTQNSENLKENH